MEPSQKTIRQCTAQTWRELSALRRLRCRNAQRRYPKLPDRAPLYFLLAVLLTCGASILAIRCAYQQTQWTADSFDRRVGR